MLHDPLAEIAADVGCPEAANRTRFEEPEGVQAALHELERADAYAQLASRNVTVRGEVRTIGDIANNAQRVFDEDRVRFVAALRGQAADYVQRYTHQGTIALGGEAFTSLTTRLAHGLHTDMAEAGCDVQVEALADRTVLGCGYSVARCCHYVASVAEGEELPIDGNDLEDYYICLHLGVSSGRTLVTNDDGTMRALQRTLAAFRDEGASTGVTILPAASVMTASEFVAMAEAM